jgi:hypothetical protein
MDRTAFGPRSASGMAGYRIGRDQSAPYSIRLRPPRAACNRCRFRKLYPLTRSHRRIRLPTFVAEHKTCEQPWGTVCAHFARASKTPAMFDRLRGEAPPTGLLVRPSPQARGQGACGAPKVGAAVPVLGETFAHDSFAKSAKFTLSSILDHNILPSVIYRSCCRWCSAKGSWLL